MWTIKSTLYRLGFRRRAALRDTKEEVAGYSGITGLCAGTTGGLCARTAGACWCWDYRWQKYYNAFQLVSHATGTVGLVLFLSKERYV